MRSMKDAIIIHGVTSEGVSHSVKYLIPGGWDNDFEAVRRALEWADGEYTYVRDAKGNGTEYKEFAEITGIELVVG